ncbi:DUF4282 domain-containing protein [uncultured Nevskia sp.]|uniref:DUF4282 domain-containing protein n=1 Tax=uncultured Nevskia sp. TaxID=228950 RepID=UPI0025F7D58F|nr:DUF4282 domain-containing protein [uncultured Nevskia sp.]
MKAEPRGSTDGMPAWAAARSELSEVLVGLTDLQLRTIVTTRMAPAIYLLCVAGVAAINIYLSVLVFGYSLALGLAWTLLIMPVLFVSGVVVVRVALEVILSIFRILVNLETLMGHVVTLKGQTETIVDRTEIIELPRIQFWKPRRSRKNQDQDDGQSGTDAH